MKHKSPQTLRKSWLLKIAGSLIILMTSLSVAPQPASAQGISWLFGNRLSEEQQLTDEDIALIEEIYEAIQLNYIEEVDKEVLLEGALQGMVEAIGDPYSQYLSVQEIVDFDDSLEGSFEGIGVQFMQYDGEITVISPIADTPADKAGLLPNDIILEADGIALTGMDTNEVVKLIRGPIDTEVTLKIQRGTATFDVTLVRASIPLITVISEVDAEDPSVGLITITQFDGKTDVELITEIEKLRADGVKSFVFDLRFNPGGFVTQALVISNMFLEDGDIMMQVDQRAVDEVEYFIADEKEYGNFKINEPYVVLINEGSASASEILAAAIQDNTDFPIIGETSFGKGTAQQITSLSSTGKLQLTNAKWLTPSGKWINEIGIEPDEVVAVEPVRSAFYLDEEDVLTPGESSEYVENLSIILEALGYDITVGNYYDSSIEAAVKQFQKDHELEETGIVTGNTAIQMNDTVDDYLEENDIQYDTAKEILLGLIP